MIKHVWLEVNGLHEWNTTDEYVKWKKRRNLRTKRQANITTRDEVVETKKKIA